MEQINTLLKIDFTPKKCLNERQELLKFFCDNLRNKKGKPFSPKMIAIKLSHLDLCDLRYMISVFKDIQNRRGNESAQKWFFWSLQVDNKK
jgi:hypothetical protein